MKWFNQNVISLCIYLYFPALCNEGKMSIMKAQKPLVDKHFTHNFDAAMKSIKHFHFLKTEFETVFCQILHPDCHGVLRSLRKLVTRSRKYDWRGRKTLKLNMNTKEKLKEIIFIKFLSKYVSQFHLFLHN